MLKSFFQLTQKGRLINNKRAMALFTQFVNPITGKGGWSKKSNDYDYHQEVANTGYGDMLHDTERNQKYFDALYKAIEQLHKAGRDAHVLDIGTGTGILAMMAVTAGADTVVACEAFTPMANCAERIFKANKMDGLIKLIKKRSTDIVVGVDIPRKANLLVTELLDTELIGEGAIGIYNHAHEHLLTDDVVCIPSKAYCYAQLVHTPLAVQWNLMRTLTNLDADVVLRAPREVVVCKGNASLHDIQLSQLSPHFFQPLTQPIEIFEFDFNSKEARPKERTQNLLIKPISSGTSDLVFYWWNIKMDLEGEILLSCAPFWAHPDLEEIKKRLPVPKSLKDAVPWRDHWMQAIYYIPKPLFVNGTDPILLSCNHDEYSLWFDVFQSSQSAHISIPKHTCSCSFHITFSRNRIGQMNDTSRNKRFLHYLEQVLKKDSHVLSLGDGSLMGIFAKKLGAASVISFEPNRNPRRFVASVAQYNKLKNVEFVDKIEYLDKTKLAKITHVFAEPYFLNSILPWDNLYFGTLLTELRSNLPANVQISPHSARIYAVPVEFLNLHKIRAPVGKCEGFDLSHFDDMIEKSSQIAQSKVEAQPLWEYPCRALARPKQMLHIVFEKFLEEKATKGHFNIRASGSCNGVALWIEWHPSDTMDPNKVVNMGPVEEIEPGKKISWYIYAQQGVHLVRRPKDVEINESIKWTVDFKPKTGQLNFNFDV